MNSASLRILVHDYAGHPFQVQLSRELARRGHRVVHAWCARLQTPRGALARRPDDPPELDFRPIDLGYEFDKYGLWSRWHQEKTYGTLIGKVVEEFKPDVVLSANTPLRAQAVLLSRTKRSGAGFVFWIQDVLGVGIRQALRRRLGILGEAPAALISTLERRLWREADHVVAISEDFLPRLPASVRTGYASVIHNWAPIDEVPVLARDNPWARAQGLDSRPWFVYTGTLGLKHNPMLLAALARHLGDRARVVVISEGPGAELLRGQALPNLDVLPFQPFERMPKVMASADVLVALLEADAGEFAVPSKVLTYLCAARPLLLAVPARNLARRLVENEGTGMAVDPDDESAFLDAATRLLQDGGLRSRMARNARQYAERTFDINRITNRFESILRSVVH